MSTTSVVITPMTSPITPFATVEEPTSTSIYRMQTIQESDMCMALYLYVQNYQVCVSFSFMMVN